LAGLIEKSAGTKSDSDKPISSTYSAWEESMERRLAELVEQLQPVSVADLVDRTGGTLYEGQLLFSYWGRAIAIRWPELEVIEQESGEPCSTFDRAMALYYLSTADGSPLSGKWIGFRELPDGGFYNQAFQGYSGNRLAKHFSDDEQLFTTACQINAGEAVDELGAHAFSFQPFPRINLAAVLWPGDEQMATKASILFDSSAAHYMPTDGLAILGSGLTSRLINADSHV
jgi:hypothetical protein